MYNSQGRIELHCLAEVAGLYCDGTPDSFDYQAVETFAASIICKCAELSDSASASYILEHFGLE